jgi:uncharacterized cupin superfamily protein
VVVPEAPLERNENGLWPTGDGWFVLNARESRWREREGRGLCAALTGESDLECETLFPQVGVNLFVLQPGEPIGMYHWEADHEEFLVLYGEPLLIVEGAERPLRQWDFVHCPPGTTHIIVGAGSGPCAVLAIGGREHVSENCNGGAYVVDEAARRRGASVEEETTDPDVAYARYPEPEVAPYRDGLLPGAG